MSACVPTDKATVVLLNHRAHTGSHALCEALGKLECFASECSERLEHSGSSGQILARAANASKPYFVTIVMLTDDWLRRLPHFVRRPAGSEVARVRVLTLVRRDLMRWSLSLYCKMGPACPPHEADPRGFPEGTVR